MVPSMLVLIEKFKTRLFRRMGREYSAEKSAHERKYHDSLNDEPIVSPIGH